MSQTYTVAVYFNDRAYGGPEEGGWWYNCGELAKVCRTFKSEALADDYAFRLNQRLKSRTFGPNQGRRDMSSVLSDGEYWAHVYDGAPPASFPDRKPHYE